jgi:hypothetical protein
MASLLLAIICLACAGLLPSASACQAAAYRSEGGVTPESFPGTAPSKAVLAVSSTEFALGTSVTLGVTVSGYPGITPEGQVIFTTGTQLLGTAIVSPQGIATISTNAFAFGLHGVKAVYQGDFNYAPATSNIVVVNVTGTATPTIALISSAKSVLLGEGLAFTATVAGGSGTPTGTVKFTSGVEILGTVTLNAKGVAVLTTSAFSLGSHGVKATYNGSPTYAPLSSNVVDFRIESETTTTLAITSGVKSVTTVSSGTPVELSASVTGSGGPVTAGQVEFCDAKAKFCTDIHQVGLAQLTSSGKATIHLTPGPGSHTYKAIFRGTVNDVTSASAAEPLTVSGLYPSVPSLAVSGGAGSYTLAATVGGNGSAAPTGTVTFVDTSNGNKVLGSAKLGAGTAGLDFLNSANPVGAGPTNVAVADFNGDGIPDLAVLTYATSAGSVNVFLGNGDGTFTLAPTSGIPGAYALTVADFNGDGIPDLATAPLGPDEPDYNLEIWFGNGDGTFTFGGHPGYGGLIYSIPVGDFVGKGFADIAFQCYDAVETCTALNDGTGKFTIRPIIHSYTFSMLAGDFTGSGLSDLVLLSDPLEVMLNNGDGTFTAKQENAPNRNMVSLATADFNGDGFLDLATANSDSNAPVSIALGNGQGTFMTPSTSPMDELAAHSIAVGAFNGNGIADLVVTDSGGVSILPGHGDGTFEAATAFHLSGVDSDFVAVGDFNGDGIADIVVPGAGGTAMVFLSVNQTATAKATGVSVTPGGSGTHQVVLKYSGDSHYKASTSLPVSLTAAAQTSK